MAKKGLDAYEITQIKYNILKLRFIMNMKLRNIPFSPPDMTEKEAAEVREAILSGWITTGPRTKKLESLISEYVGTEKTVCLNSATAALEMVLHLLDIQPEDEVIVPAYTYTATASVTQHVGCKLVMVDSQKDSVEMDYDKLAEAITERTKVICPVDLGGIVADYDRVYEIVAAKKGLFRPGNALQAKIGRIVVSADCAHSFGAWRKVTQKAQKSQKMMAGAIADFSSFSFHAVKNFTTAEGGALTWNLSFGDEQVPVSGSKIQVSGLDYLPNVPKKEGETWNELLYRLSQLFSLHGQNKDALAKTKLGAWEYDIIGPWYKCNMTDIMAALGLVQFERYPGILQRRYDIVERYNEALKDLPVAVLNHKGADHCSSHHLYPVRLLGRTREEVNKVIEKMAERGIATNVHYKPLPMMTAYKALGFDIKDYPNAYHLFENEITLPLHTKLTDEDVEYVISNFVDIVKNM
jgi:dTDP-4-amino-4,6-dideoxygalactose transaminase